MTDGTPSDSPTILNKNFSFSIPKSADSVFLFDLSRNFWNLKTWFTVTSNERSPPFKLYTDLSQKGQL